MPPDGSYNCPVCGLVNITVNTNFRNGTSDVDCRRCGEFTITEEVYDTNKKKYTFRDIGEKLKESTAALSGLIRLRTDSGAERTVIRTDNIDELLKDGLIPNKDDIEAKALYLLRALRRRTNHYGESVAITLSEAWSWCFVVDQVEMNAMINYLKDRGDIIGGSVVGEGIILLYLSAQGWNKLKEVLEDARNGFVAISFREEDGMDDSITAISEAISDVGFMPVCIKEKHYPETIMDKALGEIRRSRFVIVDLTGDSSNVLFEAGYGHGLKKEVIFVCSDAKKKDATFYARHFKIYFYKNTADLKTMLVDAIRARIV